MAKLTEYCSIWQAANITAPSPKDFDSSIFRGAIEKSQSYLKDKFEVGEPVVKLVHQRALFIDEILTVIWQQHFDDNSPVTLLAVGGYGRGELHPYSDIDVLILLDESASETPPQGVSDFLSQLWDIGLEVGPSIRTLSECQQQAADDISIATNLLEARWLIGPKAPFKSLKELLSSNLVWDTSHFYVLKVNEQQERYGRYNNTANNLEPNIKESPGGLRDIHVVKWVSQNHFNVSTLAQLKDTGFLTDSEFNTLEKAQEFLWTVRFALHHLAGRKQEKLMIDYQRELAWQLGYTDNESRLAVEQFMKDYYLCARSIRQLNKLLLQLFKELVVDQQLPLDTKQLNTRFQSTNGYLEAINPGIFAYYPYALLEVFLLLQQYPDLKGIRAATIRQIQAHRHLINEHFRHDLKSRTLFMEILRHPESITDNFKLMNELGILGAYLPEFGKIVGQMQHDLFHAYTVDQHTLFLVNNLWRFSCSEFKDELPLCSEIFQKLPKPELLYIAGLYHDIAKGRGGDHSKLGVVDAEAFCNHHWLSTYDTELIKFLVRHHLSMSAIAQKSDLDDPSVIKEFAKLVKTTERLNYLYLLTVADIRATNRDLWNSWRDSLLKRLYHSTKQWIEHREAQAQNIQEKCHKKYQHALQVLITKGHTKEKVNQLWKPYDSDYFLRQSIDEIVWQTEQRFVHLNKGPLLAIRNHYDEQTLEVFIVAENKAGLFAAITSVLEQNQLNVLDAKLHTTSDNFVLNTFIVNGTNMVPGEIISALRIQLNTSEIKPYCPVLTPRTMKLFPTKPDIQFENNSEQDHTVMSLDTHDRPGLISAVAQAFLHCNVQLINAKINTLGDQVEDVFLIVNGESSALTDSQKDILHDKLLEQLNK